MDHRTGNVGPVGLWAGPVVDGRKRQLWCAWLAWSRTRVVLPTWSKTLPTVIGYPDQAMRFCGGAPTY